jgi:uncharacterized damage-inducible protein DinB
MSDLEIKLAEARAEIMPNDVSEMAASHRRAFDAAAAIAREVVAEKDAEIATDWEARARRAEATLREIIAHLDNNDRFTAEKFVLREIIGKR